MKHLGALALAAIVSVGLAAPAFCLSPQERAFLGPNGFADRLATFEQNQGSPQGAATESVITNQGGNSDKACDSPDIAANTMTVVSSDNAGPENGITGPWQQFITGFVTLYNPRTTAAVVTVDEFYGDQTAATLGNGENGPCAPGDLSCYYHSTTATYLRIPAQSSLQVPLLMVDTVPLNPALDKDFMADFLTITSNVKLNCTANSYVTTEFDNSHTSTFERISN